MVSLKQRYEFAAGRGKFLLIFTSALFVLLLAGASAYAAAIQWVAVDSLEKMSKESGKPRMIYFYSDYCPYCAKMEKETLSNEKIVSYMNENFVASRVNTQKDQKLAMQYMVRAVPTMVFMKADGTPIESVPGFIDSKIFFWMVKYIGSKEIETVTFSEYLKKNGVDHPMAKVE